MEKFSVRKPFTVLVMVIIMIVFGLVCLGEMNLDMLPEMDLPYIMVLTTYPGASPEKVEEQVCKPLESALAAITGVQNVYSVSNENYGMVQLEFVADTDMDAAMVKISNVLSQMEEALPEECGVPSLLEIGTDMIPFAYINVGLEDGDIYRLSQLVEDQVIPALSRQEGVARVTAAGTVEQSLEVTLNQAKIDVLNDKILAKVSGEFAEALADLAEARQTLIDSGVDIEDGRLELLDGQNAIEEGRQELLDGQNELQQNRQDLLDGQNELDASRQDLTDAKEQLQQEQESTYQSLAQASLLLDQLNAYQTQLLNQEANKTALDTAINAILGAFSEQGLNPQDVPEAVAGLQQLSSALANQSAALSAGEGELTEAEQAASAALAEQASAALPGWSWNPQGSRQEQAAALSQGAELATAAATELNDGQRRLNQYQDSLAEVELEITVTQGIIDEYEDNLAALGVSYADVEAAKLQAAAGFGEAAAELSAGEQALDQLQQQLDAGWDSLDDAQKQLDDGWSALEDSAEQINEGWESLSDAEKQLADGWEEYNEALAEYEKQRREALKQANADDLVDIDTLSQLIYAQNFSLPAGYIEDAESNSWLLKVGQGYASVEELANTVLYYIDDIGNVLLQDVADLAITDDSGDSYARMNDRSGIILSVFKSSSASAKEVSQACDQALSQLQQDIPDLQTAVLYDEGDYITLIVDNVVQTMLIGALLAIVILALFLKSVKPTLVVAASIPLSVLLALICMYFAGVDLNMMSLSGLALGVGMLVDNSIVVSENIYRLRAQGISAAAAAVRGTRQVMGAIVASTLTTVSVFLPLIFTSGTVRDLMLPMSLSVIFCLGASLLIAMTAAPAAAATLLKNSRQRSHPWFDQVQESYGRALSWCLRHKFTALASCGVLFLLAIFLVLRMGVVVIPEITANQLSVEVTMDKVLDKEEAYATADQLIERLTELPGVESVGAMAGGATSLMASSLADAADDYQNFVFLINLQDENPSGSEVRALAAAIETENTDLPCEITASTNAASLASMTGSGLQINIYGEDLQELERISQEVMEIVEDVEGFEEIRNGQEDGDAILHLQLDKDEVRRLGFTVAQIYSELNAKLSDSSVSAQVTVDDTTMDVVVKDNRQPLTKENLLAYTFRATVTDEDGDQILEDHRLAEFATVVEESGVASVNRENQDRYISVTASTREGYNLTLLSRQLEPLLQAYQLPEGYRMELSGEFDLVEQMLAQMSKVLALGLLLIYLVMVAQFQSLRGPFIILFTTPLAFTGGLLGLWIAGEQLSVMSLMGLAILLGTVVNNGIVFVDYANQLRIAGLERRQALLVAGKTRMRPILMTALTTILALAGLIFGDDMTSQMGRGMAIVIAGGLTYATLTTLFVIPIMYDILAKRPPLDVIVPEEELNRQISDPAIEQAFAEAAVGRGQR